MKQDSRNFQDQALETHRDKSNFLANMRHELRTPVNAIIGYSEMLLEDAKDTDNKDFILDLQNIHKAGKQVLSLINQIFDPSKIEASKADISWGSQIRSYVLDQSRIKDLRTNVETGNTQAVLDGDLDQFIEASLKLGV